MKIFFALFYIFMGFPLNSFSQNKLDTFDIYKKETGIPFSIYMHKWFFDYGRNTYSYNPNKVNRQDSLILDESEQKCYKVFKSTNRLFLTGCSREHGSELAGDINFFRRNGKIKQVEHWNNSEIIDNN